MIMDITKALDVIAYYLSEYDIKAVKQLGYRSRSEAFVSIASLFGKNGNYLKRLRDEYDVVTNSYRNGQRNRAPRERISSIATKLKKYSFEKLTESVENIIANAKGEASKYDEDEIILTLLSENVDDIIYVNRWMECFDLYVVNNQSSDNISFKEGFINEEEGYKKRVFNNAHSVLQLSTWSKEKIGSGAIAGCINKAIAKIENLINHNQIVHFKNVLDKKLQQSEQVLYQIYCGNDDAVAFEKAVELFGAKYDLIAALFFIKDIKKYLPVRSSEFDKRFKLLGIDFTMAGKCSWNNYSRYLQIVDDIRYKLQNHYRTEIELIDAHTFIWMILSAKEYFECSENDKELHVLTQIKRNCTVNEVQKQKDEKYPREYVAELDISSEQWVSLIKTVFLQTDIELVKRIYLFDNHAATCTELATLEGKTPSSYNAPVVALAKRIAKDLNLPTLYREDGSKVWWRILFWGKYREDGHFEWKLRPELADALYELYPELESHKRDKVESAVDATLTSDISEAAIDSLAPKYEYRNKPKKKVAPVIVGGHKTYPRDRKVALNALSHAGYVCEVDESHESFIRKNSSEKYTEPHHLIPMSFSDEFEHSLDVEENIVSLCSNCHNQIHYGRDARELIEKLYEQRKELLEKVGLKITLAKLLSMYGID